MYPPLFLYINRTFPVVTQKNSLCIYLHPPGESAGYYAMSTSELLSDFVKSWGGGGMAVIGIVCCILCGLP